MIQFDGVAIRRGPRVLFENASFQIHPGKRVGLTGANGTGKSSLFALLLAELSLDEGQFQIPATWQIAHVAQHTPDSAQAAIEYVLDGDAELRQLENELSRAEEQHDGHAIAHCHAELERIGAWDANSRASRLLHGLGFKPGQENNPVNSFSGGWRMRLNLAQALMCRSDLLLLDEPTNHLDLDAVIWLESWLKSYQGTLLLISHDRDFLDSICEQILHIEQQTAKLYQGNYSGFERIRAEQLANQQAAYEKQQQTIEHMQSYVNRFRAKATKAKQAQSRLKALQRMEQIAPAHIDSPFDFSFFKPEHNPHPLLQLEEAHCGYGDKTIVSVKKHVINPGDRIGLLGPNGAGKSTLIKTLADRSTLLEGGRHEAKELHIGYFAQHQIDQLDLDATPIQHLLRLNPKATEQELRNYLGGFGFQGDRALEIVAPFSGGEKSRLVLAMLVYQQPNLLLLDEPTNHLDIEMRQALANALQEFEGAMVLVSHDRHLLRMCCDQLLLVADGQCDEFRDELDAYPQWLAQHNRQANVKATKADNGVSRQEQRRIDAEKRKQLQPLKNKLKKLERELDKALEKQSTMETELSDSSIYEDSNKGRLQTLIKDKAEVDGKVEKLEMECMELMEEIDDRE